MSDEALVLIAEALVAMAEGQERASRALAEGQERASREMTAAIERFEEAVRAMPAPVVNMPAPVVNVPAPVVNVESARAMAPAVQDVRIVGLPPLKARIKTNRDGTKSITEE